MSTQGRCRKCGQYFPQSEIFKHFLSCQHKTDDAKSKEDSGQKSQLEQVEQVQPIVKPKVEEFKQVPQSNLSVVDDKCQYCNEIIHPQDCEMKKKITQLMLEDKQPLEIQQYRKCITIADQMNLWMDSLVNQEILRVFQAQNDEQQNCEICKSVIGKEELELQFVTCQHQFHSNCLVTTLLRILNSGDQQVACPQCMY